MTSNGKHPEARPSESADKTDGQAKKKTPRLRSDRIAKRTRTTRAFPASTFEDSLVIANAIQRSGAAPKIRRITLFEELGRSADSGPSRQLIVNSSAYGLTKGSYVADYIELTPDGDMATRPEASAGDRLRARFKLAIETIAPFKLLYENFAGKRLPAQSVMRDNLTDKSYNKDEVSECIDTFLANVQYLGLLKTIAGAERLLTIDHAIEECGKSETSRPLEGAKATPNAEVTGLHQAAKSEWDKTCFYISPIGDDGSPERKHADLMVGTFVEPAMEPLGLRVVRADKIGDPGMIATQVLEHLRNCRLAIADLSFLNPNVFYEVALRHVKKLPVVQIIRKADRLPFDVNQVRSVVLDTTDIFTLVPKIETYRSDITTQARAAMENPENVGNPVSVFYPKFFE